MSRHGLLRSLFAAAALLGAAGVFATSAEPLRLEVYNPGEKAIFAVSSELLVGQREAMLIDAQFSRADAEQLVKRIGQRQDPQHYLHQPRRPGLLLRPRRAEGLPRRRSSRRRRPSHIQATKDAKLAYWGPILRTTRRRRWWCRSR